MKYFTIIFNITFLFSMTGLELATKMENRAKPEDTKSKSIMELLKKNGKKRTLKLINKSKDNSKKQLIWFLEPRDDYGIAFLKIEKKGEADFMNMWLPGFKKFRRISSQKKSDSFMGPDLSYEDMTNRDIEEYEFSLLNDKALCNDDTEEICYLLSSKPKDEFSEYSEHKTWVTKDTFLSLREESYDKDGKKLKYKEITYIDIDGYQIMNTLKVENLQKNTSTYLSINDIKINNGYSDDIFHSKSLKRIPND